MQELPSPVKRLTLIAVVVCLAAGAEQGANAESASRQEETPGAAAARTEWRVSAAEGMDALLLIGAASGDVMQAEIYADTIAFVRANMSPEGVAALDALDVELRQKKGMLTGPTLAYVLSAGSLESIDDVIASAADPGGRLRPGLEASPQWDAEEFAFTVGLMPTVRTALTALRDLGFSDWYARTHWPSIEPAIRANEAVVRPYDLIPEQERLLGRPLEPKIEILVAAFARPYGIRILGQRFVAYYGWRGEIQLRNAAHELFHPPFDLQDAELKVLLSELANDPWIRSIIEDHDPRFGYNSFMGVVNEDSTQALDQIVSERLGFGRDPGERWREADGGMHMLAAALYQAMREDGFAEHGGRYEDWLKSALRRGLLAPAAVRRRAAEVAGQDAVDAWGPPRDVPAETFPRIDSKDIP